MIWAEMELDGLTALILKALHPNSRVFNSGFKAAILPDGMFDLAISNGPLGNYGVFSKKRPKYLTHPIHDFFFADTWALLRPGGVLMYITSPFTLDKKDDRDCIWLARRFSLLAEVWLPEIAFEENAGTKAITDILIMQKGMKETEEVPLWGQKKREVQQAFTTSLNFLIETVGFRELFFCPDLVGHVR